MQRCSMDWVIGRWLMLVGAAVMFQGGCAAGNNDSFGSTRAALGANEKTAFDYFLSKGLANFQAAGIVGNLVQESGVNPNISQSGGGPGRGIAQWSAGARWDKTKGDNLVAFAAAENQPPNSLSVQLDFIWFELQTFPQYGLAKLRATTNVSQASIEFEDDYEGCVMAVFAGCAQAMRIVYSMQELQAYGADKVPLDGGASTDGGFTADGNSSDDNASDDGGLGEVGKVKDDGGKPDQGVSSSDGAARDTVQETASGDTIDDAGVPANATSSGGCTVQAGDSRRSNPKSALLVAGLVLAGTLRRKRRPAA